MIPPHVETPLPATGGTFQGDTIVLEGSLIGMLLEQTPPQVWDAETGAEIAVSWTEVVTSEWYADAPAVGGDVQTRVEIVLSEVVSGRRYRLRYPSSLHDTHEAILTAG